MSDKKFFDWKGFGNALVGMATLEGLFFAFLMELFGEQTVQKTITIVFLLVFVFFALITFFIYSPRSRDKIQNSFMSSLKAIIGFIGFIGSFVSILCQGFVCLCQAFIRFFRNLFMMFLKEILFDDQHGSQKTSGETVEINEEISTLKEKVEKLEKVLYDIERPLNSESSFKNWDVSRAGDRRTLTINGIEFAFRYCPPGEFMMGSADKEEGHKEQIYEGFWICETPITQEQWDAVGVTKEFECGFKGTELPVEKVSRNESYTFIRKLNELVVTRNGWKFELPTEEQWEYACRAGTNGSDYGYSLDDCAWYEENSEHQTQNVGMKQANNWGICDMLGNVWEFTNSKSKERKGAYIARGSGWNNDSSYLQPTKTFDVYPNSKYDDVGFRCVYVRCQSR